MDRQTLLDRLETDLKLRGRAQNTCVSYLQNVKRYLDFIDKPPKDTDEQDIRRFLEELFDLNYAPATTNHYLSAVLFFYEVTLNRPMNHKQVPFRKVRQTPIVLLSRHDISVLISSERNIKHRSMLMLGYGAGLRVSEVAALKTSDIDSSDMRIHVTDSKRGKSRYTILPVSCLLSLREYWVKAHPQSPAGYLFPMIGDPSRHVYYTQIQKVFYNATDRCDIGKAASFHTLRHCFATHLLEDGTDLFTIKELLGHASISSTSRYLHLANVSRGIVSPMDAVLGVRGDV